MQLRSAYARRLATVAALIGFLGSPAGLASADDVAGNPTSIAHAGGRGWTTPPPPPPPMAASQWTGAPTTGPSARAASAPTMSTPTWTAPTRYEVIDVPTARPTVQGPTPAPLVRRVAQGTPLAGGQDVTAAAAASPSSGWQAQAPSIPAAGWTAPTADTWTAPAMSGGEALAPAPLAEPAARRRVVTTPVADVSCGPRCAPGCGLPCMSGQSLWHLRGVFGHVFYEGDDPADDCDYWGVDIGRTFCGCWGLDAYYRWNSGKFDRNDPASLMVKDGGDWHHVGLKLTMERPLGGASSRFYWWAGLGAGYFWTEDYLDDDSGIEGFAELGLGYMLSRNLRLRAGVNVHGMDTSVTRRSPANDGQSRWLWLIAPVVEVELDF
jgi:hypothetical protein